MGGSGGRLDAGSVERVHSGEERFGALRCEISRRVSAPLVELFGQLGDLGVMAVERVLGRLHDLPALELLAIVGRLGNGCPIQPALQLGKEEIDPGRLGFAAGCVDLCLEGRRRGELRFQIALALADGLERGLVPVESPLRFGLLGLARGLLLRELSAFWLAAVIAASAASISLVTACTPGSPRIRRTAASLASR